MGELLIGVIALGVGAGLGAWIVLRGRDSRVPGDDRSALRIESRLEVQSAELRRLADAADRELEALEAATDPVEREALARSVERIVALRAREVSTYLDPSLTAPVAVAAVPDAAYAVLRRAHADAFARGVVIVPYSTALPV